MTDRTEELKKEIKDLKAELLPYSNHIIKKNPHRIQWIHQRIGWLYGCLDGRQEMRDEIREWLSTIYYKENILSLFKNGKKHFEKEFDAKFKGDGKQ